MQRTTVVVTGANDILVDVQIF